VPLFRLFFFPTSLFPLSLFSYCRFFPCHFSRCLFFLFSFSFALFPTTTVTESHIIWLLYAATRKVGFAPNSPDLYSRCQPIPDECYPIKLRSLEHQSRAHRSTCMSEIETCTTCISLSYIQISNNNMSILYS
jgi:hypothetical protein